jgi:hypothetical protein
MTICFLVTRLPDAPPMLPDQFMAFMAFMVGAALDAFWFNLGIGLPLSMLIYLVFVPKRGGDDGNA